MAGAVSVECQLQYVDWKGRYKFWDASQQPMQIATTVYRTVNMRAKTKRI